nr:hypothetical protein [Tanacetum cinerariifolium]
MPEDLHPELPSLEERIVDFSEGKVDERVFPTVVDWRTSAPKDEMPAKDTYSPKAVTVMNTHHTPIQKQPKALLCLVGLSRRYFLGGDVYPTFLHDNDRDMDLFNLICALNPTKVKTDSFGVPSTIERSPMDFSNENPSQQSTGGNETKDQGLVEEIAAMGPHVIKERRKRGNDESIVGGKSLALIGLGMGSTFSVLTSLETPTDVSDSDPLSFANPQSIPTENVAQYANISYSSVLNSDLPRERPLLEIQNQRIPPLPSWLGHPKAYIWRSAYKKLQGVETKFLLLIYFMLLER